MRAYCGLNCHECEIYIASQATDAAEIARLAQQFSADQQTFRPEDLWCDGCAGTGNRHFVWCQECGIRICGVRRQVVHCGLCADFPCDTIDAAPPDVKARLEALRADEGKE